MRCFYHYVNKKKPALWGPFGQTGQRPEGLLRRCRLRPRLLRTTVGPAIAISRRRHDHQVGLALVDRKGEGALAQLGVEAVVDRFYHPVAQATSHGVVAVEPLAVDRTRLRHADRVLATELEGHRDHLLGVVIITVADVADDRRITQDPSHLFMNTTGFAVATRTTSKYNE